MKKPIEKLVESVTVRICANAAYWLEDQEGSFEYQQAIGWSTSPKTRAGDVQVFAVSTNTTGVPHLKGDRRVDAVVSIWRAATDAKVLDQDRWRNQCEFELLVKLETPVSKQKLLEEGVPLGRGRWPQGSNGQGMTGANLRALARALVSQNPKQRDAILDALGLVDPHEFPSQQPIVPIKPKIDKGDKKIANGNSNAPMPPIVTINHPVKTPPDPPPIIQTLPPASPRSFDLLAAELAIILNLLTLGPLELDVDRAITFVESGQKITQADHLRLKLLGRKYARGTSDLTSDVALLSREWTPARKSEISDYILMTSRGCEDVLQSFLSYFPQSINGPSSGGVRVNGLLDDLLKQPSPK